MFLRHDPRLAYLLVNLSTLLWAGNITLGRALRGQVGPFTLTAARVTIAGLLFVLLFVRVCPQPSGVRAATGLCCSVWR